MDRPKCAVGGMLDKGRSICSKVIVGGVYCGHAGECRHKLKQKDEVMSEDKYVDFESITRPVIEWLNNNYHPHVTVVITPTSAELLEGVEAHQTEDYVKD